MSSHKKITKVPNGPLIKKKGPFKGSTLKTGGKLKKAQGGKYMTKEDDKYTVTRKIKTKGGPRYYQGVSPNMSFADELALNKSITKPADSIPKSKLTPKALEMMNQKNGGPIKKAKSGSKVNEAGNYTKPGMRKSLFNKIKSGSKGGNPGQWSARKAQMLAREYKSKGGGYR